MKCPYCGRGDTRVVDSRESDEGRSIRRRRECVACENRFSTYEQAEFFDLLVIKKDGRKVSYKKEKLADSIKLASKKRFGIEQVNQIVSDVEADIFSIGKSDIESKEIGNFVMNRLENLDQVAYLRFASVFKSFGTGKRFLKELNKLEKTKEEKRKVNNLKKMSIK